MKQPRLVDILLTFTMRRELQLSGRSVRLCYVIDLVLSLWFTPVGFLISATPFFSVDFDHKVCLLKVITVETHLVDIPQ